MQSNFKLNYTTSRNSKQPCQCSKSNKQNIFICMTTYTSIHIRYVIPGSTLLHLQQWRGIYLQMYGYLLTEVLCKSLRKLLFYCLCFMLQRKGTETQQGKGKKEPCPLRPSCYRLNYRLFQVITPFMRLIDGRS